MSERESALKSLGSAPGCFRTVPRPAQFRPELRKTEGDRKREREAVPVWMECRDRWRAPLLRIQLDSSLSVALGQWKRARELGLDGRKGSAYGRAARQRRRLCKRQFLEAGGELRKRLQGRWQVKPFTWTPVELRRSSTSKDSPFPLITVRKEGRDWISQHRAKKTSRSPTRQRQDGSEQFLACNQLLDRTRLR